MFTLINAMSANENPHAIYPLSEPPTIRYYGHGPTLTMSSNGMNLKGPQILTDVILHNFIPLDHALIDPAPSVYNLGLFSKLPDELLYLHILEKLDLLSLIRFRNTSRHAHYVVDTLPEFQILVKWAPQVIRGVLAVQTNVVASVVTIVGKLRQRHCDRCGKAAQHIWLPTLDRLCFLCAHDGPMPLEEEEMLKQYGLTNGDLHLIPSFRFLPATFRGPLNTKPWIKRRGLPDKPPDFDPHRNSFRVPYEHILYDTQVATQLALERTGQEIQPSTTTEDKEVQRVIDNCGKRHGCIVLPPWLLPRRCRRVMGLVFASWITLDGAESGVFCQECLYITGKDRSHAWGVPSRKEDCESCKMLRYRDRCHRVQRGHPLELLSGSDMHV
jgi:hypothetical protein